MCVQICRYGADARTGSRLRSPRRSNATQIPGEKRGGARRAHPVTRQRRASTPHAQVARHPVLHAASIIHSPVAKRLRRRPAQNTTAPTPAARRSARSRAQISLPPKHIAIDAVPVRGRRTAPGGAVRSSRAAGGDAHVSSDGGRQMALREIRFRVQPEGCRWARTVSSDLRPIRHGGEA